jgi:hypothetical protein
VALEPGNQRAWTLLSPFPFDSSAVTCFTCHHGEQYPATAPPKGATPGM